MLSHEIRDKPEQAAKRKPRTKHGSTKNAAAAEVVLSVVPPEGVDVTSDIIAVVNSQHNLLIVFIHGAVTEEQTLP